MDIDKVIILIPQLLLLFIPGYIALSIKTKYLPQKKHDTFDATLLSIVYSFIIGIVFEMLRALKNRILPGKVLLGDGSFKYLVFLLLGVVLGYILTKGPNYRIGKRISILFNRNLDTNKGLWETAMSHHENGAWATVYLKNGMIYIGKLINYTNDPNSEKKELILYDFDLFLRNDNKHSKEDEFSFIIEEGAENDRVYLQREDIIAVQIRPGDNEDTAILEPQQFQSEQTPEPLDSAQQS